MSNLPREGKNDHSKEGEKEGKGKDVPYPVRLLRLSVLWGFTNSSIGGGWSLECRLDATVNVKLDVASGCRSFVDGGEYLRLSAVQELTLRSFVSEVYYSLPVQCGPCCLALDLGQVKRRAVRCGFKIKSNHWMSSRNTKEDEIREKKTCMRSGSSISSQKFSVSSIRHASMVRSSRSSIIKRRRFVSSLSSSLNCDSSELSRSISPLFPRFAVLTELSCHCSAVGRTA